MAHSDGHAATATRLPIIGTYPTLRGLRLHSLAYPVPFRCTHCGQHRESVMVAVTVDSDPVCPACYATSLGMPPVP